MKKTEKIEMLKALAEKIIVDCTEEDLEDGVTVLAKDWDLIKAIADEVGYDEDTETEYAYVDGYYVTYDPYEDWGADEI